MSAWIVSDAHIDVLVKGLLEHVLDERSNDPTQIGQALVEENHLSIEARYGKGTDARSEDDPYVYVEPEVELNANNYSAAARCYDYQTCEHDGYPDSQVAGWIETLTAAVPEGPIQHVDPINLTVASPWGFDDRHVHPSGRRVPA